MSLIMNGTTVTEVIFNGVNLDTVIYDGVTVFTKKSLTDFVISANSDGTYTITDWKGTYNGTASTKCIIPDDSTLIL